MTLEQLLNTEIANILPVWVVVLLVLLWGLYKFNVWPNLVLLFDRGCREQLDKLQKEFTKLKKEHDELMTQKIEDDKKFSYILGQIKQLKKYSDTDIDIDLGKE